MESFLPNVDDARLRAKLNKVMAGVNSLTADAATTVSARHTEDAGHCILEFVNFLVSVAEQHGTTPHAVLGQHVVSNILIFVLERIVKPNLLTYSRIAEKHASNAMAACGDASSRMRSRNVRQGSGAASVATGRRDALEARRRRLRSDVVSPFIQLFQCLHISLAEEGEPLTSWSAEGSGSVLGATRPGAAARSVGVHDELLASASAGNAPPTCSRSSSTTTTTTASGRSRRGDRGDFWDTDDGADGDSPVGSRFGSAVSEAPLQWKNASPLNILCNHILEVLESQWLVAVVGGDYAALLIEVLRWSAYARLITPTYLVRLSQCLITLIQRVSIGGDDATDVFTVSSNVVAQEVAGGRLWVATPTADDACLYAQVVMRLCALPQMTTAYPPSSSTETDLGRCGGGDGASEALALVRRLIEVVKERHRSPTPDLRLEAYCIASLRQVCHRFRYDHPVAARAPVEVVKLLCDFFFLPHHTPRHDVWRLETMQFLTVVVSVALSNVVGEELWRDVHTHSSDRSCTAPPDGAAAEESPDARRFVDNTASVEDSQSHRRRTGGAAGVLSNVFLLPSTAEFIALLHQSVFPTMQRIFTQHRHEYCFTSRRELFSAPCSPLQEVFDFGAVVLYVSSVTHSAYCQWRAAAQANGAGGSVGITRHSAVADSASQGRCNVEEEQEEEGRWHRHLPETEARRVVKRPRCAELDQGDTVGGAVRDTALHTSAAPRTPSPPILHPTQLLADKLQEEFFITTAADTEFSSVGGGVGTRHNGSQRAPNPTALLTRRQAGDPPLVLRIGTASIRTSSAAVQDVVSDSALFLLHLFAQPCATLRMPKAVADRLIEDVLLPLCRDFGLRLGQLLLAAVKAVVSRCSRATQHYAFSVVAQRSLPAMMPDVVHWSGRLDRARGSAVAFHPRNDEAVLAPSEPVYHVLVVLLEQHLLRRQGLASCDLDQRDVLGNVRSTDALGRGKAEVPSRTLLSGLPFFWGAHHRAFIQRTVARLHAWEQDMRRICEGPGSTASPAGAGSGVNDGPPPFIPVSLALLLTRFALLVQCTSLWHMCSTSTISVPLGHGATAAESPPFHFLDQCNSPDPSGGSFEDMGLTFLCHIAAHTTFFYGSVPVIVRPSEPEGSPNDVLGGAVRALRQTDDVGADTLTVTSASLGSDNTSGAVNTGALFSAPQFMTWLDLAERYACAALYVSLAQQQVMEQSEMRALGRHGEATSLDGTSYSFASPTTVAPRLRGPLRDEVCAYVEGVCALVDAAVSLPSSQVPLVLRDAADAHWMLRLSARVGPFRADRRVGGFITEEVAAELCEDVRAENNAVAFGTVALEHQMAASHRGVSLAFRERLASSVQSSVAWLMRRDQLRRMMDSARAAAVSHHEGDPRGGGGPSETHTAVRPRWYAQAIALRLSVQCVQLLHLLLRWRRSALWAPPEDSVYVGDHADAPEASCRIIPDATKGMPAGRSGGGGGGGAEGATEADGHPTPDVDVGEEASATRADLRLLRTSPDLYADPLSLLESFSAVGGGRVYYAVLWLCHFLSEELDRAHVVGSSFPLWAALHVMYRDVGMVLLDPMFACIDARHTVLRFTAAVAARLFKDGVCGLSRWRPSNPTSREVTRIMSVALHTSVDTLRTVLWASSRTGIGAYTVQPLLDTSVLYRTIVSILCEQSLLDAARASPGPQSGAPPVGGDGSAAVARDDILLPSHHRLLDRHPFLPTVLRVLPALLRLLALIGCLPAESTDASMGSALGVRCCRSVIEVLQILFARFRYQIGPGLCSDLLCATVADVRQLLIDRKPASVQGRGGRGAQEFCDAATFLYVHEGRLLEMWTAQLTDPSRVDMPVCTPAWQRALLQAAFVILPGCEPVVAEVLGRTSFEFLVEKTPYAVRHHAAQQVGTLFHTFSARRPQVLHTLLTKAREGMLSSAPMICSTSLLALSEAVRAAPELLVDVLYTLLECWATQGFMHHRLVVECLKRMSAWVLEDAALTVVPVSGALLPPSLPYTQLCRMHVRPLLFLWLCEYRHPLAALPVECFGYKTQAAFSAHYLSVLSPLALLLLTESRDAQWSPFSSPSSSRGRSSTATGESSLYEQLIDVYTDTFLKEATGESMRERESVATEKRRRRTESSGGGATPNQGDVPNTESQTSATAVRESDALYRVAPLCMLLAHFPDTVTQLLVLASHAPVSLFAGDAAGLDTVGEAGGSREHLGCSHRRCHGASSAEYRATSDGYSGRASAPDLTLAWASVAQRCLYWLEAQINTVETSLLAQSVGMVLAGRSHLSGASSDTTLSAAAARAAPPPHLTATSNAAEVLLCYLQRRRACSQSRRVFDVLVAAQADALMEALVALHHTAGEPARLVYGTPEQLRHALSWVAEKVTAVPLRTSDRLDETVRLASSGEGCDAAITVDGDVPQALTSGRTGSDFTDEEAMCLTLLVPSAAAIDGVRSDLPRTSPPSTDQSAGAAKLTEDPLTRLFLQGNGTFLYALLHAAYRSSTALLSVELQFRALQQLSLLVHICTRWCSSRVLGEPHAAGMVLAHLLHWLRRSPAVVVRQLVCGALLHVWPVARAGCCDDPRGGKTGRSPVASLRRCRLMLARSVAPLTSASRLIASTWAALCRSDPALLRSEWIKRALAQTPPARHTKGISTESIVAPALAAAAAAAGAAGHETRSAAQCVVDVDEPTDDEGEVQREGATHTGAAPDDCTILLDGVQWTQAMYEAHRSRCLAPISTKCARERLFRLRRLLRYVSGYDEEGSEEEFGDALDSAGGEESDTVVDRLVLPERCAAPMQTWAEGTSATLLQDVTVSVDSAQALLVRCLQVAAVCLRAGCVCLAAAGTTAQRHSGKRMAGSLQPAELLALDVRSVVLDTIQELYHTCHLHVAPLPTEYPKTSDQSRSLLGVHGVGGVALGVSVTGAPMMTAEAANEQLLAAFRLLRALSLCVVLSGEAALLSQCAATISSSSSGVGLGAVWSMYAAQPSDSPATSLLGANESTMAEDESLGEKTAEDMAAELLAHAYTQQVRTLEQLVWCADADASALSMCALRLWVSCIASSLEKRGVAGLKRPAQTLWGADEGIVQLMIGAWEQHILKSSAASGERVGAIDDKQRTSPDAQIYSFLQRRLLWVTRCSSSISRAPRPRSGGDLLGDAADAHLSSASVWGPLRQSPPNQRAFFCRFVLAAANTYGLMKKSLLWGALVPLLMAELRTSEGLAGVPTSTAGGRVFDADGMPVGSDSAGRHVHMAEPLLLPVLLHAMCARESEGQRAMRRQWSAYLERCVFQQPTRTAHVARTFLHVLHQCFMVLLRATRQRGLKGAKTASSSRLKATSVSSAALASGDKARTEGGVVVLWPSTLGSVPCLQDMHECFWLSDIPASRLASAASEVGEPHLALLFSQLSGESLYGPRTGAAALCGEGETTRSALMLRDSTSAGEAVLAVSSAPYSVLFPLAKASDYPSASSTVHTSGAGPARSSGGRARERHDAVREKTRSFAEDVFDLYESVQGQLDLDDVVGVSAMMRPPSRTDASHRSCNGVGHSWEGSRHVHCAVPLGAARRRSSGSVIRRAAYHGEGGLISASLTASGMSDCLAAGPFAAAAWLDELRLLEEREARYRSGMSRGGADVSGARAAADGRPRGAAVDAPDQTLAVREGWPVQGPDPCVAPLQRAALLLLHGFPLTALDVLLNVYSSDQRCEAAAAAARHRRRDSCSGTCNAMGDAERDVGFSEPKQVSSEAAAIAADAISSGAPCVGLGNCVADTANSPSWTPAGEASLQALLAEAAWKCGQWSRGEGAADEGAGSGSSRCVPRAVLDRLSLHGNTATPPFWTLSTTPTSVGSFYVHLLYAFLALQNGQPLLSLHHVRYAESALRQQLSPTTFVTTVMAAEALNEVRDCAMRFLAVNPVAGTHTGWAPSSGCAPARPPRPERRVVELPMWLRGIRGNSSAPGSGGDAAGLATAQVPSTVDYASRELLYSVRHALCQVYGDDEGWYRCVLGATEQALLNSDAATAHRWLCDWTESQMKGAGGRAAPLRAAGDTTTAESRGHERQMDLVLRTAQVAYGLGRWQEALALLQPAAAAAAAAASGEPSDAHHCSVVQLRTAPRRAPQDPRVVQQLMLWHAELRLLPPSQLVRDPFLSRAAASDDSGACSFLLARLCHTLADEIAGRLTSHEHQQLRESVEESKELKANLEAQLEAATQAGTRQAAASPHSPSGVAELGMATEAVATAVVPPKSHAGGKASLKAQRGCSAVAGGAVPPVILSEDQLRVIRRRIRELAGDIKRLEDEWYSEKSNFGLYRRSAINAYSRFLQFHQAAQRGAAGSAAGHAHRSAASVSEVKCLPVDPEEDVIQAVFGFVELWVNVADMEHGGNEVLNKVLDKAVERIPTAVFVPLAGQLTAQLGGPHEGERLAFLVSRLARDYPLNVVWPLLALCHGHTFAKSRDVNTLHKVDEAKITAARALLAGLAPAPKNAKPSSRTDDSASAASLFSTQIQHAQLLSSAYLELAFDRSAATAQTNKRHAIRKDFMLIKDVRHLRIPPPTFLDSSVTPPSIAGGAAALAVPRVIRYLDFFTTPGGVNVPKVLRCELSDGRVVRQLLKAGDDLRQDALIEQVFATANQLFRRRPATRPLHIRIFTIVPLAPTAGILQWVEHTIPLGEYLTGRHTGREELPGAHERYFPGEPTTRECRIELQSAPPSSKCQVLMSLYERFTPALHYFFLEEYPSAPVWVDRQQAFTRSVAASSIVGYAVGLGDRHINNILLHKGTAEVVHIDLGIAFDQNKLLPVPELVPFRLTRNMIDGLGVRGTEGSLRPCAEAAMSLLRSKRELIRTILSSVMHDPLARWVIGAPSIPSHVGENAGDAPHDSHTRQHVPLRTHGSTADAARTLARIDAKLRGNDGGDVLSVPTHVRKLVEEAQRVDCLALMFPGWSQWV
ncbi:uncharacterized protein JKF63_08008 [Porcisia hertigi]|uniref:non-specific serine/threonine protein kinase n=2 Tax=Porcisia hertigi TaxID=2761500 RepID=A0A836KVB3_9TRYP|nr:hypothetical protein JKF63_08008 [Porcisia hertigi]